MHFRAILLLLLFALPVFAAPPPDEEQRAEIASLIRDLGADEYETRESAFERLREIGPDAAGQLREAVENQDPEVARVAERLLAEIRDTDSGSLLDALESRDESFKDSEEFHAMVGRGRALLPELYRILDEEEFRYPQYSYYRLRNAFAVIGELAVDTDIDDLLARLDSANIQARILVEPILKTFDKDLVKAKVVAMLANTEAPARARALLIEMCVNTSFSNNDPQIEETIRDLLADEEEAVRASAVRHAGFRRSDEAFPRLLELAGDDAAVVRAAALRAMRYYRRPESEPVLRRSLRDPEAQVRAAAIETLRGTGGPDIAPLIRPFLKDPDPLVRSNAAQTLAQFGDRAALPVLIESLEFRDEEFLTRTLSSVLQAIGRFGDESALEPLFELLMDSAQFDRIKSYRYMILRAIVEVGGASVLARIRPMLVDRELQNIHVVLDALSRIESDEVIPILIAALDREETHVRTSAVRGLGARGHKGAAPRLRELILTETDPWFLSEAVKTLAILGCDEAVEEISQLFERDLSDSRSTSLAYSLIRAAIRLGAADLAPKVADLADSSPNFAYIAVDALGALGNPAVIPKLVEIHEGEQNDSRRYRIELSLARLGKIAPLEARLEAMPPLESDPRSRARCIEMLIAIGRLDESLTLIEEGLEIDPANPGLLFDLACVHAREGRSEAAFEALEKSGETRMLNREVLISTPDLSSLFDLPRFAEILKKAR